MDDLTMWSLVVGTLLPPLISVIQQPTWPDWVRAVATAAIALVVGGLTAYFTGDLEGKTLVSSFLVVLVAAITTYKGFWKPTSVSPRIEAATSGSKTV